MTVTQTAFRAAVFDPDRPAPTGLSDGAGRAATKRFDVYRNNVAVGLTEALRTAFPTLRILVGDEFFTAMSGVYLRNHPPANPLMMHYGDQMPDFLRKFPPARSVPYLPGIARLELALRRAYHAADATPLTAQALQSLAPDALMSARFAMAPAVQLITSPYPIHGIWRKTHDATAPNPSGQRERVLVTRPDLDPQMHVLSAAQADFTTALIEGQPLGAAMTKAGPDLDLGATLGLLMGQGALTDLQDRKT